MSRPDAAASAALDGDIRPVFFAFLDFVGDPIRANSSGQTLAVLGSGYPEMDGESFIGISHKLIEVSPVRNAAGGSDTVTARVSGLPGLDDDTLALLANPTNWQGRQASLWRMIRNVAGAQQGAIQHYYTGYMTNLLIGGSPEAQAITVEIETYLATFSQASNRTYLDQAQFDPGDLSAEAAIALANGIASNPATSGTPTGGAGGGAGERWKMFNMDEALW